MSKETYTFDEVVDILHKKINACKNPRLVYTAMMALAPIIAEARTQQQRTEIIDALTPPD